MFLIPFPVRLPLFLVIGCLFLFSTPALAETSPPPGAEYPVAYWAQTHLQESLLIYRSLDGQALALACRNGPSRSDPPFLSAWRSFRNPVRTAFCSRYPFLTHHILGEAPYFMLSPPGSHK